MFTPYSWITYDGDGTTATFGIPIPYVAREHVHVYIGWDPSTRGFTTELEHGVDFTFASGNEITTTVAPGALEELTILRITPIEQPLSDWQTGSPPTARELDVADRQVLYAVQEFIDQTLQAREDLDTAVLVGAGVVLVDNLSSLLTTAALTANQGRVLRLLMEAAAAAAQTAADAAQTTANAAGTAAANAQTTANAAVVRAGDTMTGNLTVPSLNSGQLAGLRNRIINGNFAYDQRYAGAALAYTAGAAFAYGADRWYGYCSGANVNGQRITVSGAQVDLFRYQFTGAASVTLIGLGQRIEAQNCRDLAGKTAVLSVNLSNSLLTTVSWQAFYANTNDAFGTRASPTRTSIASGSFTVNSTYSRYSTPISIPLAATTGIEIVFTVGAQTSGTWVIGEVQLETGSVATPFERRPAALELDLCLRYFEKSYDLATAPGTAGATIGQVVYAINLNTGTMDLTSSHVPFSVRKRATPTVSVFSPVSGISARTHDTIGGSDITGVQIGTSEGSIYVITYPLPIRNSQTVTFHWTAGAEL